MKKIDELKAEIEKAEKELTEKQNYLREKRAELTMLEKIRNIGYGDYVECNIKGRRVIGKVTNIHFLENGQFSNIEITTFLDDGFDITSLSKWQPKRGDLCIFWDYDVNESIVAMFDYSNTRVYYSNQDSYVNCIPFISERQFKEHIGYEN